MKKFISAILVLHSLFSGFAFAEESGDSSTSVENSVEDSVENSGFLHENDGKKHYLTALGFVAFWNVGLCSYNRFVCNAPWAKVGWDEWGHFWEREWKWDRDWYWTNFVLHPYQGSYYYMASRGSNLNKLESFAVTSLGSVTWELLCETNAPSINDMVYTTVGAFSVGEMLYRLSLEADEISSLLGFAVNPTRLWTQAWTRQKPLGTSGHIHELSLKFSAGNSVGHTELIDYAGDWDKIEVYPVFFSPEFYVSYGDPYGHDSNDPYSQFEFLFRGAIGRGSGNGADCAYASLDEKIFYNIRIFSNGMLLSRAPDLGENRDTTVGLVMEYDFDWHSYYLLSSLAPGFAVKQRIRGDGGNFEWQAHLAAIVLGTSDFYYYRRNFDEKYSKENRGGTSAPYNYNVGVQTVLSARYRTERGSGIGLSFRGYAMYDFYDQLQWLTDGDHGTQEGIDLVGIAALDAELAVSRRVRIGLSEELYTKYGMYRHIDDVLQFVNTASVYAKIQAK